MTVKELTLLGKAMKALLEVGAMDQVKEIIDYMASTDKTKDNNEDNK